MTAAAPVAPVATSSALPRLAPQPASLAEDVVLGIDLGTTTCRAAVYLDGAARLVPIPSERGATSMPSVVAVDSARNLVLIGTTAKKHRVEKPGETIVGFKRLLGRRARSIEVKEMTARFAYTLAADPEGDVGVELAGRVYGLNKFSPASCSRIEARRPGVAGPARQSRGAVRAGLVHRPSAQRSARGRPVRRSRGALGAEQPSAVALAFGFGKGLARQARADL